MQTKEDPTPIPRKSLITRRGGWMYFLIPVLLFLLFKCGFHFRVVYAALATVGLLGLAVTWFMKELFTSD